MKMCPLSTSDPTCTDKSIKSRRRMPPTAVMPIGPTTHVDSAKAAISIAITAKGRKSKRLKILKIKKRFPKPKKPKQITLRNQRRR